MEAARAIAKCKGQMIFHITVLLILIAYVSLKLNTRLFLLINPVESEGKVNLLINLER